MSDLLLTDPQTVRLEIYGTPRPQGSKTAFVRGGHAVVTEGGSKSGREGHQAWRQAVATAARDWQLAHDRPLLDGPLFLRVDFRLQRPKSIPKSRAFPAVKPDLDKLIRSVLDSLSGVVIADDARVVCVEAAKVYAGERAPGASILIREMIA